MSEPILFKSTFLITDCDQNEFDRVARISGQFEDLKFTLEISVESNPCTVGENVHLAIAHKQAPDITKDGLAASKIIGRKEDKPPTKSSVAGPYDFICHGKIYHIEEGSAERTKVYAYFGDLLMYLEGPHDKLSSLKREYIYLLLKK